MNTSEPTSPFNLDAMIVPMLTLRHLMLVLLLAFAASQTLAQQHIHGQEDFEACVICAHGDHAPATSSHTDTPATDHYPGTWSDGQNHNPATINVWPDYLGRAPPLF